MSILCTFRFLIHIYIYIYLILQWAHNPWRWGHVRPCMSWHSESTKHIQEFYQTSYSESTLNKKFGTTQNLIGLTVKTHRRFSSEGMTRQTDLFKDEKIILKRILKKHNVRMSPELTWLRTDWQSLVIITMNDDSQPFWDMTPHRLVVTDVSEVLRDR